MKEGGGWHAAALEAPDSAATRRRLARTSRNTRAATERYCAASRRF